MSKSRASIFGDDDTETLDVAGIDVKAPPADQVRAVSQAAKFMSREPGAVKAEPKTDPKEAKRAPRRYRTGRNPQLSVKALSETVETLYAITDQEGWVLGYTLQRAVDALQRELKQTK